ncbi:hydroxymethylbilane synthase [Spongiimicrobium salis]|uniref:hydroxymethylbilane synthase n=1 Tax=Spongiimicrobium salis TaxID=1667022 RepID=UPI00374CC3FF
MNKIIRIGTRDSELALWQAHLVQDKLKALGHQTKIVAVKSTGDLVLDKPLYELGITGIFTKTLDVAMINGDIDIAVHSMKDVPTKLPKGIVQAAVLERGHYMDLMVYKDNEEFLAQKEAIIATGSLRRKAQWLNRYPTHTVTDIRGNVNTRLQKLNDNSWNGAIFAAAGLDRLGKQLDNTIGLTWMVPAPAQGAVMVVAMEKDAEIRDICAQLNHEPTAICTTIERDFLNLLEGGCTAPIGAYAYINKDNDVKFKGVLLNRNGTKKIEVTESAALGKHQNIARSCSNFILNRGGKRLMSELAAPETTIQVFSTKKLTPYQLAAVDTEIQIDSEDFIKISPIRISEQLLKAPLDNVIISSKNAVESLLMSVPADQLQFKNIYCVGRRTKRMIEQRIGKVTHSENSAKKLAQYLVEYMSGLEATYFCSDIRLDELPDTLAENNLKLTEIETYKTKYAPIALDKGIEAVLFYSPSTVKSYIQKNSKSIKAFCIGETTATEARKHFAEVEVARIPTVESLIDLVNENYLKK